MPFYDEKQMREKIYDAMKQLEYVSGLSHAFNKREREKMRILVNELNNIILQIDIGKVECHH